MQKAKSLTSLNRSMLSCLFFVVATLFNPESIKEILKDMYIASSSMFSRIRAAMESNLQNGYENLLSLRTHLLKKKRIR